MRLWIVDPLCCHSWKYPSDTIKLVVERLYPKYYAVWITILHIHEVVKNNRTNNSGFSIPS